MGYLELQIFGHVCFHDYLEKMRSQEAAVAFECVAWRTHGFSKSPGGCCPKLLTLKIVLQCASGSDASIT